jgi:hypothetical protein
MYTVHTQHTQAEGDAAYAEVQVHGAGVPLQPEGGSALHAPRLAGSVAVTTTPAAAAPPGGSRHAQGTVKTPSSASAALLSAQLAAAQAAVSPSVMTPGVMGALAAAGAGAGGGLDAIRAKLAVLKEQIDAKARRMNPEKQARIQAQIAKLERSLEYVEQQRVRPNARDVSLHASVSLCAYVCVFT